MSDHIKKSTKSYKVDPIVAVIFIVLGIAVVSLVFGMMFFPVLTQVCASELLYAVARLGYFGIFLIFSGLMLEAYHLYEEHKKHIVVVVVAGTVVAITACWLLALLANHYSC